MGSSRILAKAKIRDENLFSKISGEAGKPIFPPEASEEAFLRRVLPSLP